LASKRADVGSIFVVRMFDGGDPGWGIASVRSAIAE
jgi:hypothetical protein